MKSDTETPLYRYRFGSAEFDESRFELRVGGLVVELEQKPLQLLGELLRHVDEVITRDELFDSVWGGRRTVDNVLTNAIAKLRKALGSVEEARVVTVPRIGYRLIGPVERVAVGRRLISSLELKAGLIVPGREHFVLENQLSGSRGSEVWLARHEKTRELRVFKFSSNGERLGALKREATLYRVLREGLGERVDIARIVDWNFEVAPYFLECEYAGENLALWAASVGELKRWSLDQRLALFLQIVDAVAAAHGIGVIHKDLKPENVLVMRHGDGWRISVTDFGSGRLLEPGRLEEMGITQLGATSTVDFGADSKSGTPLYLAPELIEGRTPTVQSDVYALGMMLYQLAVADLRKPLAPGWEHDIDDPILCEDIAAATQGNLTRRLGSATELAERLRHLGARRTARERARAVEEQMALTQRALERARVRLPWLVAAIMALTVGAAVGLWLYHDERAARLRSDQEAARAEAINRFLNDDLLGAADPSGPGGSHNPSIRDVLGRAAARLEGRFSNDPATKASIDLAIGNAYFGISDYPKAELYRRRSIELDTAARGAADPATLEAEYQLATVLMVEGKFDAAEPLLDSADRLTGGRLADNSPLAYQAHWTRAAYYKLKNDPARALAEYQIVDRIRQVMDPSNPTLLFRARDGMSWCDARLDRNAEAERILRDLMVPEYTPERVGPIFWVQARTDYAAALMNLGKYDQAEKFTLDALAQIRESLGADHFFAGTALNDLGELYVRQGLWDRAVDSYRQAYPILLQRTGADGQGTLIAQANLGIVEYHTGQLAEAVQELTQVHAKFVQRFGESSPLAQSVAFYLACALSGLGKDNAASALAGGLDAVSLAAAEPRDDWPQRLQALKGEILLDQGRPAEAERQLEPAVAEMEKEHTPAWDLDPLKKALQRARQLSGATSPGPGSR